MLIKNVRIRKKEGNWDILIKNGIIKEIGKHIVPYEGVEIINGNNMLVMPPYVDSHCHLDYAGTYGDPGYNISGTLFEAIDIWGKRKLKITKEDIRNRAIKVIKWQVAQGTQYIRTHINSDESNLVSIQAMLEIKEELSPLADIQIVAFPQQGLLNYRGGLELAEEALKMGVDAIGAIPHFEDTREDAVESIKEIFKLASKYGVLVDVHCDETDDDHSRSIEVVASQAYRHDMGNMVTASHTTAMHSYNNAYVFKLFGLFKRAGINFVCNPTINMHLQGRYDSYPKRRGLTRVKELLDEELNVSLGTDDIIDPFYPLGNGDMLEVLNMGIHALHLTGYNQLMNSIDLITDNGAKTLNIDDKYGIEVGRPGNLIFLTAEDEYDILRRQIKPNLSIRGGKVIAKIEPAVTTVYYNDSEENIDYSI